MVPAEPKLRVYIGVFIALVSATGVTVALAYVHLGRFHAMTGLAIAILKALLILTFFMHLLKGQALYRAVALSGLLLLALLIGLALCDFMTRSG